MAHALLSPLRRALSRFQRDTRGNVAMIFALCGAALIGMVGLTVDFTRAQSLRAQMQNAVDGAVLVAERSSNLPNAERDAAARAYFDQTFGRQPVQGDITFRVIQLQTGGHRVEASGYFDNGLSLVARMLGSSTAGNWNVSVAAEAQAEASPPIEVALVLDNTGSMSNDMQALRDAAGDLTEYLLSLDGDSVQVALVPFVAQVNVGSQYRNAQWMDSTGISPYNGELLEDRQIALLDWTASMGVMQGGSNLNCLALSTRPWGTMPDNQADPAYTGPYNIVWVFDNGLAGIGRKCRAFTPDTINYFALFDQLPGSPWKGCVEARTIHNDQDIRDTPGNPADPETLFSPFFWIDTGGTAGQASTNTSSAMNYQSANSYLTDTRGDIARTRLANGSAQVTGSYADNFDSSAFSNSNGTTAWGSTPWVETGDNSNTNSPSAGQIRIDNPNTTNAMTFRDDDNDSGNGTARIQRTVNLAGAQEATISYSYVETGYDAGETVTVLFSADGTNFNQTIQVIDLNSNTGAISNVQLVGPFTANSAIRFVVAGTNNNSSGADVVAIDNLVINISNTATATMTNGNSTSSVTAAERRRAYWFNVFKYRGDTTASGFASYTSTAPDVRGPNRGCPTPIVPLTNDLNVLSPAVDAMRHWNGGGTNQAEGLAWGWRVLSPTAPFTEGAAYGETRKIIVLMSDGENTNVGTDAVYQSDYSAFNYRGLWDEYADGSLLGAIVGQLRGILNSLYRRNIHSRAQFVNHINDRERLLCENIKREDIVIYTVLFRETDQTTENLMRNCATSSDHFFRADSQEELQQVFTAIGSGIGQLRLTH